MRNFKINPLNTNGRFGRFGGRYVPEMMLGPLIELEKAFREASEDREFALLYSRELKNFSGRPTPLLFAENLTRLCGGARIYLKLESQGQTGSHKINNAIGQALLAKRMNKKKILAETGAGQHGLATATVAARYGLKCEIFMGLTDMKRQRPNVFWMEQLGATVSPVNDGSMTLKEAVNASIRAWIEDIENSYLLVGSVLSAHPYPLIVREFQSVIGREVKKQIREYQKKLPDYLIACVGGGSNSIGLFHPFLNDAVKMIGVEAGGMGIKSGKHASRFSGGREGIIEGYRSIFLQDKDGRTRGTHSVAAGLDYPGVGPEHALMHHLKRIEYTYATDSEAIEALKTLVKTEGIIPALESSHAVAQAIKTAGSLSRDKSIVVNISGRGDKDIFTIAEALGDREWKEFLKARAAEQ